MPQSLANVVVHLVFSTKGRSPKLTQDIQSELHPYLAGVLKNMGCQPLQLGGVDDHVHLLFCLSRTVTIAAAAEKVKTSSTKWIKEKWQIDFAWQGGYAALSVSSNDVSGAVKYVQNQAEHHRKFSFQDELRAILTEHGVEFDERYLWD